MWNADQWLSFTQTRHDANYTNLAWNASTGVLSFNISHGRDGRDDADDDLAAQLWRPSLAVGDG